jgi:hypothetical protein
MAFTCCLKKRAVTSSVFFILLNDKKLMLLKMYSMKKNLLTVCLLLLSVIIFGQEGYNPPHYFEGPPGDDVFASPDVQAFHKYQMIPEKLYSGKLNVDIPFFVIQSGGVNVPISLSYNTGGIKVSEIASSVGIGWNLNAGGSILKIVRDLNDDDFYGTGYSYQNDDQGGSGDHEWMLSQVGYHRKGYPNPYSYWNGAWFHNTQGTGTIGKLDSSPDFFHVNAPGLSTKFYLKDNTGNNTTQFAGRSYEAIFLDHSGSKIEESINRSSEVVPRFANEINQGTYSVNGTSFYNYNYIDFNSFEIINTNGVKYLFDNKDYSETTYKSYRQSANKGLSSTNWNLTKISDPKTHKEVIFTYEEYFNPNLEVNRSLMTSFQNIRSAADEEDFYFVDVDAPSGSTSSNNNLEIIYNSNTTNRAPKKNRLSSIQWDKGTIYFTYNFSRIDAPGEKALTDIIVKNNNGKIIKHYRLNYSYFNSKENCSSKECKRLKLNSIDDTRLTFTSENVLKTYEFEYYYNNPLPKRNSLQKDYLGYYNNNGFEWNGTDLQRPPNPTLHFYKNQGKNSILPFKRNNGNNYRLLSGGYTLEANSYSFSGLLKKITYPTGGSSEFEFENHSFNFEGGQYIAGGARIKKQKLDDGNGNLQEFIYEYKLANGKTSGYINTIPTFAHLNKPSILATFPSDVIKFFTYYHNAKYALELTEGAFIGYERVIKKQLGNGYTVTTFSSPNTYPNGSESTETPSYYLNSLFLNNSNYPSLNIIDFDIRRGKIQSQKIYSQTNTLLQEFIYDYDYKVFNTVNLNYLTTIQGSPFLEGGNTVEFDHTSFFNIERNLETKITEMNYFSSEDYLTTNTYKTYDSNYPFVKEERIVYDDKEIKTKLYYPHYNSINYLPYVTDLVSANRLNEPLQQKTWINNSLSLTKQWNYGYFGNGIILPKKFLSSKGLQSLEEKVIYHDYDSKGNAKEVSKKDGSKIHYVWGYSQSQPIAKIEGYTDEELLSVNSYINTAINKSNLDTDTCLGSESCKEQELRQAFINLRNALPKAQITSYTYDPLIGVTSITDLRGRTVFYEYDEFNRLEFVKDQEGKILNENQYNYKN